MRIKGLLFFLFLSTFFCLKAQTPLSFTRDVDSVFLNLNKTYITSGILYDRVYPFARLHMFNTTNFDTTNVQHFNQAYYELYNAKYNNTTLINPDTIEKRIKDIVTTGKVPIGIANFQFNQVDTNSLADNLISSNNGIYYDVANRPRSPYWTKKISIISPLMDSIQGLQINFQTSPTLFLQNTGNTITLLQVDFNNGGGLISVGLNNTITINYNSYGEKIIKFIVKYQDNSQVTTFATLKLVQSTTSGLRILGTTCDKEDRVTATTSFTDYENNTFKGQGNIKYYFSTSTPCNGKVKKPIIILDGFDPGDDRDIGELYRNFLNNTNRYPFADDLLSKGYDIVVLNFDVYKNEFGQEIDGGAEYIERNAFVLIALINKLKQELSDNGSTEQLVIVGPSMGGLISRYALAYMEKTNQQHNTRLWISFDAPHNGANISLGVQKFLEFFGNNGNKAAKQSLTSQLGNPAAKQL